MSLVLRRVEAPFLCFKSERKFEKHIGVRSNTLNIFRDRGGKIILKD
jgi:hypothetical protein